MQYEVVNTSQLLFTIGITNTHVFQIHMTSFIMTKISKNIGILMKLVAYKSQHLYPTGNGFWHYIFVIFYSFHQVFYFIPYIFGL